MYNVSNYLDYIPKTISAPKKSMKVQLPALLEIMTDRPINQQIDRQTNGQTGFPSNNL